ncbi:MAG TPA: hypothetical protein VF175_07030, partial [Lacipirellula sp.]
MCSGCTTKAWILAAAALVGGRDANAQFIGAPPAADDMPSVAEMIEARTDVWGEAARRQPDGASYEFFENLLPPLQWVNTDFRDYPIVLSAPRSPQKARLVSNGSAVNPRANKPPMWHEQGTPVHFFVGPSREPFGEYLSQLEGPTYEDGYLPVVNICYRHGGVAYRQQAFAPVDGELASHGAACVRFTVSGGAGQVEARLPSPSKLRADKGFLLNDSGDCVVSFGAPWKWQPERKSLVAKLKPERPAELTIFSKPINGANDLTLTGYEQRKHACTATWQAELRRGIRLSTPETRVNEAWRAALIGSLMIAVGDRPHYSATNAYAKLYEGECGDTLRSLMLLGRLDLAAPMMRPLLEFNRHDTRFHVAGHKLQLLAHFYWLTRDAETVRAYESLWRPALELILTSREPQMGLLPKDRYAGDITQQVYSLNSNANCWRALRDMAAMFQDMGIGDEADLLREQAVAYREAILKAVVASERHETQPPFIPLALLANEPPHDPLTATRMGSYYNLMAPYIIGSEIFGQNSERENWLIGYLEQHGAIAMGMIRSMPHQGQFRGEPGINPLYGLRYSLALLRRDEREKAITGFYGHLAHGMTRDTYIGGEGSRFLHGDSDGRSFYLPPNSSSNAAWLVTLRNLLVQDWDLNEDSQPET